MTQTEETPGPKFDLHVGEWTIQPLGMPGKPAPPWCYKVIYHEDRPPESILQCTSRKEVAAHRPCTAEIRRDRRKILLATQRPSPWKAAR